MSEIKKWLEANEPDFETGLKLFTRYSRNRALFLYLSRKQDMKKLRYELEKLSKLKNLQPLDLPNSKPKAAASATPPTPDPEGHKIIKPNRVNREDLPEDLQSVYDEIGNYYKLQRSVHEKMKLATTDEARAALRAELVEIDETIAAGWKVIDEGLAAPASKAEQKEQAADPAKISQQINTARSAVSRALKAQKFSPVKLMKHIDILIEHQAPVNAETRQKLIELNVIKTESNLLVK